MVIWKMIKKYVNSSLIQNIFWTSIILICWELFSRLNILNSYIIPPFSKVFMTLISEIRNGELFVKTFNSLYMVIYGYIISIACSFLVAFLCIKSKIIKSFSMTLCTNLTPLPGVAVLPVIILFFGINQKAMLALMLHSVIWPMIINILQGIDVIPNIYVDYGRNLELSKIRMMKDIYLCAIMPNILTGLRVGWSRAWRALISAEMVFGMIGNVGGIGYYIYTYRAYGNMANVMSGIIIIMLIGILAESLFFRLLEKNTVKRWGLKND